MKSIMMSIRPKWVVKILNGEKTIEVRKKFPVDYVGWVYIYCTKDEYLICDLYTGKARYHNIPKGKNGFTSSGKVVARFWCDNVKPTYHFYEEELCALSCLTDDELFKYLGYGDGYGIYITKLEIFDKPRDISEFKHELHIRDNVRGWYYDIATLKRPPQSWLRIIEGE